MNFIYFFTLFLSTSLTVIPFILFIKLYNKVILLSENHTAGENFKEKFIFLVSTNDKEEARKLFNSHLYRDPLFNTAFSTNASDVEKTEAREYIETLYEPCMKELGIKINYEKVETLLHDFVSADELDKTLQYEKVLDKHSIYQVSQTSDGRR